MIKTVVPGASPALVASHPYYSVIITREVTVLLSSYPFLVIFLAADVVFCPFPARKCPSGLKISCGKTLKMPLPEPKVVKMGYANMLSTAGFMRPKQRCF
jgi:hypothetical protein